MLVNDLISCVAPYPVLMPSIRRATPADADILCRLSTTTFIETYGYLYDAETLVNFLIEAYDPDDHRVLLAEPDYAAWFVEDDGTPIGYALAGPCNLPHSNVHPEDREIKRLFLLDGYQNIGLGSVLIERVLEWVGPRTT